MMLANQHLNFHWSKKVNLFKHWIYFKHAYGSIYIIHDCYSNPKVEVHRAEKVASCRYKVELSSCTGLACKKGVINDLFYNIIKTEVKVFFTVSCFVGHSWGGIYILLTQSISSSMTTICLATQMLTVMEMLAVLHSKPWPMLEFHQRNGRTGQAS